jgi:glucose-6-phosphate-specific signal transduction histidine kinase
MIFSKKIKRHQEMMSLEQMIIAEIERRSSSNESKEKINQNVEEIRIRSSIVARLKHQRDMYMKSRGIF